MANFDETLTSLFAKVVTNTDEIDSYICNTEFVIEKYEGPALHGHDSDRPYEYLKGWCWTYSWDEYFRHVMDLWDGDRMSAMRFNALIERLSAPAAKLDVLVPRLEAECRRFPNVPESVIKNAREMHTCVNSFLNSADDGLNYWKRQENILVENEVRRRRPIIREDPEFDDSKSTSAAENTTEQTVAVSSGRSSVRRRLHSVGSSLTSDSALLALTGIVSVVSCIIEGRAFFMSTQIGGNPQGSVGDPNFYNAVQNFLLQALALYTVMAPALRSHGPRYGFWTWLLSVLTLGSGSASVIVYPFFTALSPLLVCVASILQAFVTLQLVFALDGEGQKAQKTKVD